MAAHDSRPFPELLDKANIASAVWADTAYGSARNERFMEKNGFVSKDHFRKSKGRPMGNEDVSGTHKSVHPSAFGACRLVLVGLAVLQFR